MDSAWRRCFAPSLAIPSSISGTRTPAKRQLEMTRLLSLIESRREIELSTSFDFPPMPIRTCDWHAIDAATYDIDRYDGEAMQPTSSSPIGYGRTRTTQSLILLSK